MKTILFQGDSITDAGRSRQDDNNLGIGYPTLVSGALGMDYPGQYRFCNRGVSGNRVVDLYARIKVDIINLQPDILSLLVGTNDAWHEYGSEGPNGVSAEKYFKVYSMLMEELKEELPDTRIMILEPFVLCAWATEETWQEFRAEVELRAQEARKVAERYGALFVPLQERFDEVAKTTGADYWLLDGVHPSAAGHELIKRAWIEGFRQIALKMQSS